MKYLLRIMVLPFFTAGILIFHIKIVIVNSYLFIKYGGEFIYYNKQVNAKTIRQTYTDLINKR